MERRNSAKDHADFSGPLRRGGSKPLQAWGGDEADAPDFAPLPALAVAPYLEPYGYHAADAHQWRQSPSSAATGAGGAVTGGAEADDSVAEARKAGPRLSLLVAGHREDGGHTWYTLACSLEAPAIQRLEWHAHRRLAQLRLGLHDRTKAELGVNYPKYFGEAPFAKKGGLPGTTARLHSWFAALAECINAAAAPPALVAIVLRFLDTPDPVAAPDGERSSPEPQAGGTVSV